MRWSWVNFQCRGVLLVWIRVGQGPTALAVGACGGCFDIFTLTYPFSPLSPSLWETTRYRLKYCLKGSLSPKTTNQPTYNWTWSGRAMVLPTNLDNSRAGPTVVAVGAGEGCSLCLSLWRRLHKMEVLSQRVVKPQNNQPNYELNQTHCHPARALQTVEAQQLSRYD